MSIHASIQIIPENGKVRIILSENLTAASVAGLQEALMARLPVLKSIPELILDLTRIDYVDSAGLKLILGLYKSTLNQDQQLHLEVASQQIFLLLSVCGLGKFLKIKQVPAHGKH